MKRFWIGVVTLAVLLVLGSTAAFALGRLHRGLADTLDQAAILARDGQREQAADRIGDAAALWERYHHAAAAFADHEPLEEMDSLFARLEVFCRVGTDRDIADACVQLASLSRDVAESHCLNWWSLL